MAVADVVYQWLEKLKKANAQSLIEWRKEQGYWVGNRKTKKRRKAETSKLVVMEVKPKPTLVSSPKKDRKSYPQYIPNSGYVYLMRSGNGYHKIGISKNINNRLDGLKRQFPVFIEVIHRIKSHDYRKVEKFLHNKFSAKHVEYEWFNLSEEDIRWIMSLKDYELD